MIQTLVVDDEVVSTEGIRHALNWESLGIVLYTANNIMQAERLLQEQEIDLLITDIQMPRGSGYDLLRWMRERDYRPLVIILTSYGTFEYARLAIDFQCIDYLLKPVTQKTLLKAVQKGVSLYFEKQSNQDNNRLAEYWNSGREKRQNSFWREVLDESERLADQEEAARKQSLLELQELHQVSYLEDAAFIPTRFEIAGYGQGRSPADMLKEFKHRLRIQVCQEVNAAIVSKPKDIWLIAQLPSVCRDSAEKNLQEAAALLLQWEADEQELAVSCRLGVQGDLVHTVEQLQQMQEAEQGMQTEQGGVVLPEKNCALVSEVKKYVREHMGEELSRKRIAESVFLSEDHVSRIFHRETGVSLSRYITEVRMQEARRLLETTELSVAEIAWNTGYYNNTYFSRAFRIEYGISPLQYRKQSR